MLLSLLVSTLIFQGTVRAEDLKTCGYALDVQARHNRRCTTTVGLLVRR